jgi:hypothetical protein
MTTKIINTNAIEKPSEDLLLNFETQVGVNLPEDYRKFLLNYNGGRPIPDFFWIEDQKDGSCVYEFYGLYSEIGPYSINYYYGNDLYGIPSSMIPIADDGTGNNICMGVYSDNLGEIFFLDHELHPFHDANSMIGISKIADSFTDFLRNLETSPD